MVDTVAADDAVIDQIRRRIGNIINSTVGNQLRILYHGSGIIDLSAGQIDAGTRLGHHVPG